MSAEFMLIAPILFLGSVISVPIASKLGLGSVLGYLLAGIAMSPLLGFIGVNVAELQHFSEFGVVMMLFLVGLEMSPKALWDLRARIFALGGLQVAITMSLVAVVSILFEQ
jgi:CPA2 family monovalent cation:H+ antiporter-2